MCCAIQIGRTALHYAAISGSMSVLKFLVEQCNAVITTHSKNGHTPISDAVWYTRIVRYLKAQLKARRMKMIMESDILPFHTGVRGIIVTYMQ